VWLGTFGVIPPPAQMDADSSNFYRFGVAVIQRNRIGIRAGIRVI
jgi:hypothetical protein